MDRIMEILKNPYTPFIIIAIIIISLWRWGPVEIRRFLRYSFEWVLLIAFLFLLVWYTPTVIAWIQQKDNEEARIILGMILGMTGVLLLIGFASPILIKIPKFKAKLLQPANEPQLHPTFGFEFGEVFPGRGVLISRGGDLIKKLINWEDFNYAGRILVNGVPLSELTPVRGPEKKDGTLFPLPDTTYLTQGGIDRQPAIPIDHWKLLRERDVRTILQEYYAEEYHNAEIQPLGNLHGWLAQTEFFGRRRPWLQVFSPLYWWKRWVLRWTSIHFFGLQPWQGGHIYEFTKQKAYEAVHEVPGGGGVRRVTDYRDVKRISNHIRIRPFYFVVQTEEIKTAGGLSVRPVVIFTLQAVNGEKVVFGHDDWGLQIIKLTRGRLTEVTKRLGPETIIAATLSAASTTGDSPEERVRRLIEQSRDEGENGNGETSKHELAQLITIPRIERKFRRYGLEIMDVDVVDEGLVFLHAREQEALTAEWRGIQIGKGEKEFLTERAEGVDALVKKLRDTGAIGEKVLDTEALIKATTEGRGTTYIDRGKGGDDDSIKLINAQIGELKDALKKILDEEKEDGE